MYSLRLNDASSMSERRQFTKTCSMCGRVLSACVPQAWGLTGTIRQPARSSPWRSTWAATAARPRGLGQRRGAIQENQAGSELLGQLDAGLGRDGPQEPFRFLQQQTTAV